MASELFQSFGASANNAQAQQNPRDAAMSLMNQQAIQIPQGMENNPNAIIQHLMQSGRIPQGRLNMAQQILSKLFRR